MMPKMTDIIDDLVKPTGDPILHERTHRVANEIKRLCERLADAERVLLCMEMEDNTYIQQYRKKYGGDDE